LSLPYKATVPQLRALAKLFTTSFLAKIISNGHLGVLRELAEWYPFVGDSLRSSDLRRLFEESYELLLKQYRFEYIYKNQLYRWLRNQQSFPPTHVLTELRAGRAVADLVELNGNATVYEIKTEMDSIRRLSLQLESYRGMFSRRFVVTHEAGLASVLTIVLDSEGVIVLSQEGQFQIVRQAQADTTTLDHKTMFSTMRRSEYSAAILNSFGCLPDVSDAHIFESCFRFFLRLSIEEAQESLLEQLKLRTIAEERKVPDAIAPSLRLLMLSARFTERDRRGLYAQLS
jgi:hypothetical protein